MFKERPRLVRVGFHSWPPPRPSGTLRFGFAPGRQTTFVPGAAAAGWLATEGLYPPAAVALGAPRNQSATSAVPLTPSRGAKMNAALCDHAPGLLLSGHEVVGWKKRKKGVQLESRTGDLNWPDEVPMAACQATASMSRLGNCWDNAVAESFFATLKRSRREA